MLLNCYIQATLESKEDMLLTSAESRMPTQVSVEPTLLQKADLDSPSLW